MAREVTNSSAYIGSLGNIKVRLLIEVFNTEGEFRIDLDELLIRFTSN